MTISTSQVSKIAPTSSWSACRFHRDFERGGFKLCGFPDQAFDRVMSRLFTLGASYQASGTDLRNKALWVSFGASAQLAGKLALLFPTCDRHGQLVVSEKGILLSGTVEQRAKQSRRFKGSLQKVVSGNSDV